MASARGAISSPLLESSIDRSQGILLNISGSSSLGLMEVNEAAEVVHSVAHQDANIIFGTVIDDALGDEVRVTVIAAGFESDRQTYGTRDRRVRRDRRPAGRTAEEDLQIADVFATAEHSDAPGGLDLNDEFDVPDFLR